ncbi:MAG: diguanylate cyclase [Hassallia sp. WJT32-NPBG1]|jgi:diguanylate cyclase (GGDEF)-like protein|nr:diguanylate cyclase [Hassallia sp. WJT32-NPBG1]
MIKPDYQNNPPLILIVDDEKTLRLVLKRAMEKEGYRVVEACGGQHCLDICQEQMPDLILLDAMMPAMDGFTCCAKMRASLADDCPPVLMITALDDKQSVNRAFEVGATDYITKPINWGELNLRISRLLGSRWAIAEHRGQIQRECKLTVQIETANRESQRHALFDNLTQLATRHYFDEYLQREWKRLQGVELPLSLILCDIDFFPAYNDTYGHAAGDECLCKIAYTINKSKRRSADLVARYAHDEFAIALPNTSAETAFGVAEAIRSAVKATAIVHANSKVSEHVTLSIGVASIIPSGQLSINMLITKASKALNQAKIEGRDRIFTL